MTSTPARARLAALPLALAAAFPFHASAQAPALRETVVTATRTPTRVDEQLADVTVVDRAQIARSGLTGLPELLATLPGVQITPDTNRGALTTLFLRGTSNTHAVVLVDGQRVSSATAGGTALQHLPLEQIERIEVLRGPASSLYGSDAIGGVIQVFTRRGGAQPSTKAALTVGSYGTVIGSVGRGGSIGDTRYHLQAGAERSAGFSEIRARADGGPFDSWNPDRDSYHQRNLSLALDRQLAPGTTIGASYLQSEGDKRVDGLNCDASFNCTADYDNRERQTLASASAYATVRMTDGWSSTLRLGEGRDDLRSWMFDPSTAQARRERYATRQRQASWQNDVKLGPGLLVAALDWREVRADTPNNLLVTRQQTDAASLGYQAWVGRHLFQGSARHDRVEGIGSASTGTAGYGYRFAEGWVARASAGTGFRAPTFNDLYWPFDPVNFYQGNPALRPETSRNTEVGVRYDRGTTSFSATAYRNRIRGLIQIVTDQTTFISTSENVDTATIEGLSLAGRTQAGDWTLSGKYDVLSARDDATGNMLQRRVPRTALLDASRRFGALDLGVRAQGFAARYNNAANTQRLPGFGLLALRASWRLDRQWTLTGSIQNALDKTYAVQRGAFTPFNDYATAGRAVYVGLRYSGL